MAYHSLPQWEFNNDFMPCLLLRLTVQLLPCILDPNRSLFVHNMLMALILAHTYHRHPNLTLVPSRSTTSSSSGRYRRCLPSSCLRHVCCLFCFWRSYNLKDASLKGPDTSYSIPNSVRIPSLGMPPTHVTRSRSHTYHSCVI